eukprot:5599115-Prymnesium_polylepis.1
MRARLHGIHVEPRPVLDWLVHDRRRVEPDAAVLGERRRAVPVGDVSGVVKAAAARVGHLGGRRFKVGDVWVQHVHVPRGVEELRNGTHI